MSYSTKALSLFGTLPLILKRFSPEDVVLWYLYATVISLQFLIDFGFRQTFARMISYAFGGATNLGVHSGDKAAGPANSEPNIPLLNNVVSIMKYVYTLLTALVFLSICTFGTWSVYKAVNATTDQTMAWASWIVIIIVTIVNFYSKIYLNILEGLFKIALVRRVETFTSLAGILNTLIVLYFAPTLFNVVLASQFWVLVSSIRDWYLCKKVDGGFYSQFSKLLPFDKKVFKEIWGPAWRGGVGGVVTNLITNLSSIVYAQFGNTADIAAYLLAMKLISQLKEVSMAPFYSKLPLLAIQRVKNQLEEFKTTAKRGMMLSHGVYIIGFIGISLLIEPLLRAIGSKVEFVDMRLWVLIGWAFYMQRFGGMHLQLYLTTNHVIAHITDTVSGILFVGSAYILAKYIGVYALPAGMLIGYAGFLSWYAAIRSYRSINVGFWSFEKKVSIPFVILLCVYTAWIFIN